MTSTLLVYDIWKQLQFESTLILKMNCCFKPLGLVIESKKLYTNPSFKRIVDAMAGWPWPYRPSLCSLE